MLTAQQHADEARISVTRALQDVSDGQFLQASNQAWHAAKHAINAAAVSRNLAPVKYPEKRDFVKELVKEPGNENLTKWLSDAWRLHGNADQGFMVAGDVARDVQITALLVNRLLQIAGYP